MTYVIHGATGAQGAPVASALAAAGRPVVPLARRAGAAAQGPATVAADYSSAQQLTDLYRGAAGVFVHLPLGAEADRVRYAHNIVAAIREASPARVVFSTSGSGGGGLSEPADSAVSTLTGGLEAGDISYAVVRPRLFLENLLLPQVVGAAREEEPCATRCAPNSRSPGPRTSTSPMSSPTCSTALTSPAPSTSDSFPRSPARSWRGRSAHTSGARSPTRRSRPPPSARR